MKRFSLVFALLIAVMGTAIVQAQDTATPEPTVDPAQATPEPTPEPLPVWVRFVHWSPDAPAVDVYLNEQAVFTGLGYLNASDYQTFEAGTYSVAAVEAGGAVADAAITTEVELDEGTRVTIAAVGSAANGTLAAVVSVDDYSAIPFGNARIYAYHAVEGVANIDLFAGEDMVITELGFPGTFTDLNGVLNDGAFSVDVPAGTYDISARLTADSAVTGLETPEAAATETTETTDETTDAIGEAAEVPSLVTLPAFVLEPGMIYTIAVVGTADAPQSFVSSMAGIAAPQPSALDVAMGNANFSILVVALEAADPSIAEALSAPGDLTVFAPTNTAFDAMLTAMNMTTDDLLANTELLNAVLRYHVVGSRNDAAAIAALNGQTLPSLQGEPIGISVNETGGVVLNGSINVTSADIAVSNGVVHVIDSVLVPPSLVPSS